MSVARANVPPRRLDTGSRTSVLLAAMAEITINTDKHVVINLFDFIILIF